jgi:hypothetical protein
MRTTLGVAYMITFLLAAALPFPAFGAIGLLVFVPTVLWLASGLRARTRRRGDLTDGVVGWPGLTAAASGASGFAVMTAGGRAMTASWLGALAACGVLEMARARVAKTDNLRAEGRADVPRRW